jgi:hypothetical protein
MRKKLWLKSKNGRKIRGYLFGLGVCVDVYRPERFEEADIFREVREDPKLETEKYLLNYYKTHSQSCLIEFRPKQQNEQQNVAIKKTCPQNHICT